MEEVPEDGIKAAVDDADRDGDAAVVGGVVGVSDPPGGTQATEEGKGKAINNLITSMEELEVGEYKMDEGG